MTTLIKLADAYAENYRNNTGCTATRAALVAGIEALQAENAALKAEAETYSKAYGLLLSEWDALQAEVERLKDALDCDRAILKARTESRDALAAKLVPLTESTPREASMKMPEPVAWADDAALQGRVGNVCSESAKRYWEKSDWVDRKNAELHKHPLYDKQALIDLLEEAAKECDKECDNWDEDRPLRIAAAAIRDLKEQL